MSGFFRRAAAAATLALAPLLASAMPLTYDLSFETAGQSMWATGAAAQLDRTVFLGAQWQNQGVDIDLIAGDANTSLPNPARGLYDAALATCRALGASTSACINGQSARVPVPALGSRPRVRSCSRFNFGCQARRLGDVARRTAYDVAFAACRAAFSSSVCRNGQSGRVFVPALGSPPPSTLDLDTRTGVALEGNLSGRAGIELGVQIDSGSVDANVSYQASLEVPDTLGLDKSNPISFNPQSQFAGVNSLNTTFPTIELSVDAVMDLSGAVTAEACLITQGCATGSTPVDISERASIVSFNADGNGGVQLVGRPPSDFGFPDTADGFPFEIDAAGLATVTLHLPQPNASGGLDATGQKLTASGQDDLVDLILDVDNIIATAAGVPGLFGSSFDIGGFGSVGFDIINLGMGPTIDLAQEFELDPTLFVTLLFDEAVQIGTEVVTAFTSAWDLLPDITFLADVTEVTPVFFVQADLNNELLLDFDLQFLIDLLQITYDFGPFEGALGIGNILDQGVDLFRTPALFDALFRLTGFNLQIGETFTIDFLSGSSVPVVATARSAINPVSSLQLSEPESLLLLALAMLACAGRRRRLVGASARVSPRRRLA